MAFEYRATKETKKQDFNYKVIEDYGSLGKRGNYELRLRLVAWNGNEPKYDIRPWKDDPERGEISGKGITLSGDELKTLAEILNS